jgi:hypothetical protein
VYTWAMKKILALMLVFLAAAVIFYFVRSNLTSKTQAIPVDTPRAAEEIANAAGEIELSGQKYAYAYFKVEDIDKLSLIPNFSQKKTSDEVFSENSCKKLINGGFYSTEETSLGLFTHDGKTLTNWTKNTTLNAILSVNSFAVPRITREVPEDSLKIALQSGPLLIENASLLTIKAANENTARRSVAAVSGENELYFLIIYSPTQMFEGPSLRSLPQVSKLVSGEIGVVFADAINLDGGSASAFIFGNEKLSELTLVGSFFCEK